MNFLVTNKYRRIFGIEDFLSQNKGTHFIVKLLLYLISFVTAVTFLVSLVFFLGIVAEWNRHDLMKKYLHMIVCIV